MGEIPRAENAGDAAVAVTETGAVIVDGVLEAGELAAVCEAVGALEKGYPFGRNNFEGERSHRLYSLVVRGPAFERVVAHELVCDVLDRLLQPNWLLSNCQSIRLYPGETCQPWHTDDGFYPIPRPRPFPLGVSTIWAIDPFTAANGATEVWPGSHRWLHDMPPEHLAAGEEPLPAEMTPGSVLIFDAALWHRGGANTTDGTRLCLTNQYCQPWLRPQESQLLIAPPAKARALSPRIRSMLGYNIHPPFIGQVEGKHPLRLVDEADYRANRGADAETAERILVDPDRRLRGT